MAQAILLEDVDELGQRGDPVDVSPRPRTAAPTERVHAYVYAYAYVATQVPIATRESHRA